VLDYITSIGENEAYRRSSFVISQNYPNPFKEKTEVDLYLPEDEYIRISVRDILGREMTNFEKNLGSGNHSFTFYPGKEKYYLLSVTGKQTSQTIKMLNANSITNEGKCKIVYNKYEDNVIGYKSRKAMNDFGFNLGDELEYIAFSGSTESSIIDSPTANHVYTFQYVIPVPCPGTPTVVDYDGNVYNTVQIGTQCWMKQNLKTTSFQNGLPIPNVTDSSDWANLTTSAYVWYDNDTSYKDLYGALYSWYTVDSPDGLCPDGWHVPNEFDWDQLIEFIGSIGAGSKLKSCRQVNSPLGGACNISEHPRWDFFNNSIYGIDKYGFSGLPGGVRNTIGEFVEIGKYGVWWSNYPYYDNAWYRLVEYNYVTVVSNYNKKRSGVSVRCVKY
ncbi:MAG: hypothetical protein GXO89_03260, partial [Chlorobi bacterium]|nr:hypothetical protein [Chlorobiota bacterium]